MGKRPGSWPWGLLACLACYGGPAFSSFRARVKPWDKQRKAPRQHKMRGLHYVLVIDGDVTEPATWEEAQSMVRRRGQLVESYACLPPDAEEKAKWAIKLGIKPLAVPRGRKNPNGLAMAMELGVAVGREKDHLVQGRAIALLGCKTDFCHLVRFAQRLRIPVVALLTKMHRPVVRALKQAGADVLEVAEAVDTPRIKAVLQPDGGATFASLEEEEAPADEAGRSRLQDLLHELQYTARVGDPAVPAIAKCFHANGIGPLDVWPSDLALEQGAEELLAEGKSWEGYVGDLAYVEPVALPGFFPQMRKAEFGTRECGLVVGAGGPFVLKSTADLADRVLRRLGYLEGGGEFKEAALNFARENRRRLQALEGEPRGDLDEDSMRALLHGVFVSSRHDGRWFSLPDASPAARLFLNREDLLANVNGPRAEVMEALKGHARLHGLPECETFQEQLQQFNSKWLEQLMWA